MWTFARTYCFEKVILTHLNLNGRTYKPTYVEKVNWLYSGSGIMGAPLLFKTCRPHNNGRTYKNNSQF